MCLEQEPLYVLELLNSFKNLTNTQLVKEMKESIRKTSIILIKRGKTTEAKEKKKKKTLDRRNQYGWL